MKNNKKNVKVIMFAIGITLVTLGIYWIYKALKS